MPFIHNLFGRIASVLSGNSGSVSTPRTATVSGAVGVVYTVSRLLGSSSTLSLIAGTDSNLGINNANGEVSTTVALGYGVTKTAVVREVNGQLAVEYPVVVTSSAAASPTLITLSSYGVTDWTPGIGVTRTSAGQYLPTKEATDILADFLPTTTVRTLYVDSDTTKGNNTTGDGTSAKPYLSVVNAAQTAPAEATLEILVRPLPSRILWGSRGALTNLTAPTRNIILRAEDNGELIVAAGGTSPPVWTANGDGTYTCGTAVTGATATPPVDWSPQSRAEQIDGIGRTFVFTTGASALDASGRAALQPGQAYKQTGVGVADLTIRPFGDRSQSLWQDYVVPSAATSNIMLLRAHDAGSDSPFFFFRRIMVSGGSPWIAQNTRTTVGGRGKIVLDRCGVSGSTGNGLSIIGSWLLYNYDWKSDATGADALNIHDSTNTGQNPTWISGQAWAVHVRPTVNYTGLSNTGTDNNETSHDNCRSITIMPTYRSGNGRVAGYVGTAKSVIFGGSIGPSTRSQAQGYFETVSAADGATVALVEVNITGASQGFYELSAAAPSVVTCYGMTQGAIRTNANVTFTALVGVETVSVLPSSQIVSFGRMTRAGHGGHALGYSGTGYLGITAGDASSHWTVDDSKQLVPAGTFGAAPATLSASYTLTVSEYSDSAKTILTGVVSTVTVNTVANRYTVTGKNTGTNLDTNTVFQLRTAIALVTTTDYEIYIRDGAVINPTGGDWRARRTTTAPTGFTGENHILIRPESDYGSTIRRLDLDSQNLGRVRYLRFSKIVFELTAAQYASNGVLTSGVTMLGNSLSGGAGTTDIDIDNCRFRSTPASVYGLDQARPVNFNKFTSRIRFRNNDVWDCATGFYTTCADQIYDETTGAITATTQASAADASRKHTVTGNCFGRIGYDVINLTNSSGCIVTDNTIYDKVTAVQPWDVLTTAQQTSGNSPYNTGVQPHGDCIAFDYSTCKFGTVVGNIVERNIMVRGLGRDTMPFYTTPPYPATDSSGYTPNTAAPYPDAQGIFFANNDFSSGRTYVTEILNPIVRNNVYIGTFARAINLDYAINPIVEFNTTLGEKSVILPTPAQGNTGAIYVKFIRGTIGRVSNNIGTLSTIGYDGGALTSTSNNIPLNWSATSGSQSHSEVFAAPIYGTALVGNKRATSTTPADMSAIQTLVKNAFKAKVGGIADIGGGIFAGAFTSTGAWNA